MNKECFFISLKDFRLLFIIILKSIINEFED